MILESTLIVSNWLRSSSYGVNALLPGIPRKRMDGTSFDAPTPVTIYDDMQDESVATNLNPDSVPAIIVFCDSDVRITAGTQQTINRAGAQGSGLTLVVAYIVRDWEALRIRQEGSFVLRAVRKSLNKLNSGQLSLSARKLNDIRLNEVTDIREQRVSGAVGRSTLAGFIMATLSVTDLAPQ